MDSLIDNGFVDITPTPRILRVLGEIPFSPWQCIAELLDNSIDAFAQVSKSQENLSTRKIIVSWSSGGVAAHQRTLEVIDTGVGMDLGVIQSAVRAGYSSNDPINSLGLFGMGFNIATAKLGETTQLISSKVGDEDWVGVEIDFRTLISSRKFLAPVIRVKKQNKSEHGTRILVSRLKEGAYKILRDQESQVRRQLEEVYTPLLTKNFVDIVVQGKKLTARPACIWSDARYIIREGKPVHASIIIDEDLGNAMFDTERNAYLTPSEQEDVENEMHNKAIPALPSNVVQRRKHLHGWLGVQRYSDPNDFGIDFVRNGRKILLKNKTLFSYENPLTGTLTLEYPIELGTTVGGRLVGEIHVDYLLPTYQKNDFDRTDQSWYETIESLRGSGPCLPRQRKAMGFPQPSEAPLAKLINAYRRSDPGTKNLSIETTLARQWGDRYKKGEAEYQTDAKWWRAAQDADLERADKGSSGSGDVDSGQQATDNPNDYLIDTEIGSSSQSTQPGTGNEGSSIVIVSKEPGDQTSTIIPLLTATSDLKDLRTRSRKLEAFSKEYKTRKGSTPFNVRVWEVVSGAIIEDGNKIPCSFFRDGQDCDFVYDPKHSFITAYPIGIRELLALFLSERFKVRDNLKNIGDVFEEIYEENFPDAKIDRIGLQERASSFFENFKDHLPVLFQDNYADAIACVQEATGETESTLSSLSSLPDLQKAFQNKDSEGVEVLRHVPARTVLRLVDRFPEFVFDGKYFKTNYLNLKLSDPLATERSRTEAKDRILGLMKEALWVLGENRTVSNLSRNKAELSRCSYSLRFLTDEVSA